MPFDYRNWGVIQPGGTQEFLQDGSVIGAPGIYTYQSQDESLLDLSAVDYFSPVGNTLFINDLLYLSASDGTGLFYVLAVDFESGNLIIGREVPASGDVSGPGSSTVNAVALWNNTLGTLLKNSSVLIDSGSNISGVHSYTGTGVLQTQLLNVLGDATLLADLGISGTTTGHDFVSSFGGRFYFRSGDDTVSVNLAASESTLSSFGLILPPALPGHDNMALSSLSSGITSFINCGYGAGTRNAFAGLNVGNETLTVLTAVDNSFYGTNIAPNLTSGFQNSFFGSESGNSITDGSENCGFGYQVFQGGGGSGQGQSIIRNSAFGSGALGSPGFDGDSNTAVGWQALARIDGANGNTALGARAGYDLLTSETGNVLIANNGVAGDNFRIRIGDPAVQTSMFQAGINGVTVGSPRMVTIDTTTHQMGTQAIPSPVAGLIWSQVTSGPQVIVAGHGYFVNSGGLVTFDLPASATMGDQFAIVIAAGTSSSFTITQATGQRIQFASGLTTVGASGALSSTGDGDSFFATYGPSALHTWIGTGESIGMLDLV